MHDFADFAKWAVTAIFGALVGAGSLLLRIGRRDAQLMTRDECYKAFVTRDLHEECLSHYRGDIQRLERTISEGFERIDQRLYELSRQGSKQQ